jgi:hypothetical protein
MSHHDEFDLDVRLASSSSLAGSPKPLRGAVNETFHTCPTCDTCPKTCDTCQTCLGQPTCDTCATCDTQCGQDTCGTCATCDTQCNQQTCIDTQCGDTCAHTCTCDTFCGQATCNVSCDGTCIGEHTCVVCPPILTDAC